jgi:uncharacterized sporulation protein YeaH/YhbH (DUF444 family)
MSHIIIDRRKNSKGKSTTNRQRFLKRVKKQVNDAVKDVIRDGKIDDIINNKEKKIKIPGKGLSQPTFQHDKHGGIKDIVSPGNKEYNQGDRAPRPPEGGGGSGKKGSVDGEGEDEFSFHLTKEEFLDLFFEDLELPDMVKKNIAKLDAWEMQRAGFSVDGNQSRLNIKQSMRHARGRKIGLRKPKKRKLKAYEEELATLTASLGFPLSEGAEKIALDRIEELKELIAGVKRQIAAIPFLDDMDLRYNRWEKTPVPTTQAVMFGIMDVSASMGEWEKEMAKRFFMLMLLFLHYNYERVDIVWIRHTQSAKEVDEDEFFHSKETGGTVCSSALELMDEIIKERYPVQSWNIFGCQISDGDNWYDDNLHATEMLQNKLLPVSQYFAYIEVDPRRGPGESDLWGPYENVKLSNNKMEMAMINDVTEIYPVFRKLFEKREA